MSWKCYRIVFRLFSPLHVGWFKIGNIQRTRPYVTGRALWGALTERLTRDAAAPGNNYKAIGDSVNRELAFSYFYPTAEESGEVKIWPWSGPDEFAWRYLNTYASTALNPYQKAAEEASLHEVEYIAPKTRDAQQVYLSGYVFEKRGCGLNWRGPLPHLQLGGERGYGWGRVILDKMFEIQDTFFSEWRIDLSGNRPVVYASAKASLYAHTVADGLKVEKGRIEPLVGRETMTATGFGRQVRLMGVCWMPGSVLQDQGQKRFYIGNFGIWKRI